jgi:hypothetical protein
MTTLLSTQIQEEERLEQSSKMGGNLIAVGCDFTDYAIKFSAMHGGFGLLAGLQLA